MILKSSTRLTDHNTAMSGAEPRGVQMGKEPAGALASAKTVPSAPNWSFLDRAGISLDVLVPPEVRSTWLPIMPIMRT